MSTSHNPRELPTLLNGRILHTVSHYQSKHLPLRPQPHPSKPQALPSHKPMPRFRPITGPRVPPPLKRLPHSSHNPPPPLPSVFKSNQAPSHLKTFVQATQHELLKKYRRLFFFPNLSRAKCAKNRTCPKEASSFNLKIPKYPCPAAVSPQPGHTTRSS